MERLVKFEDLNIGSTIKINGISEYGGYDDSELIISSPIEIHDFDFVFDVKWPSGRISTFTLPIQFVNDVYID
jgi:hypothetical protein